MRGMYAVVPHMFIKKVINVQIHKIRYGGSPFVLIHHNCG